MAMARAVGHPDYSGTFIPEIWSTKLNVKFYDAVVAHAITNNKYEGEIKSQGDTVNIRQIPDTTIRAYSKGQTLVPEKPTEPIITLVIDKAYYWYTVVDDIDKHQSDINLLNMWATDASRQMAIQVDTEFLQTIYASPATGNYGTTAGVNSSAYNMGAVGSAVGITKTNTIDYLMQFGAVFDEQNVPMDGRWIVVPHWMRLLLKTSDLKDVSMTGDRVSPIRNGRIGMLDTMTLYGSNNLQTVAAGGGGGATAYYVMGGHMSSITFASQIVKTQTFDKLESQFGSAVRGLNVYGYRVVKPEALSALYCYKA